MNYYSGIAALDAVLAGGQGIPGGSIVEIYGASDAGKTALALWFCRTLCQDPGQFVSWVATERLPEPANLDWAGLDAGQFIASRQDGGQAGLETAGTLLEKGAPLVVLDSVAALVAEADEERYLNRILSVGLPPCRRALRERGGLFLLVNQERLVPGTRGQVRPAGDCAALLHAVDFRIRLWPGANLVRGGERVGRRVHFQIVKNDSVVGGQTGRFNVYWERGLRDLPGVAAALAAADASAAGAVPDEELHDLPAEPGAGPAP